MRDVREELEIARQRAIERLERKRDKARTKTERVKWEKRIEVLRAKELPKWLGA